PPPTHTSTLSLPDALPIFWTVDGLAPASLAFARHPALRSSDFPLTPQGQRPSFFPPPCRSRCHEGNANEALRDHLSKYSPRLATDRKSTRLNSSHVAISYA